jgi:hypothetical protein
MAETSTTNTCGGIATIGNAVAAVMSYMKWHLFWLAVGHYFCGWFYITYYFIEYGSPFKH